MRAGLGPPASRRLPAEGRRSVLPPFCLAMVAICRALVPLPAIAAEAPPGASSCSGCHTANEAVETPVPRLAGVPAPRIVEAMQAFRTGQLPATIMPRLAKGFSDDEIAAIAAWYAAQPAP